ncbi:hypothetical protein PHISCL_01528 [Aspergillus sclerotialis]|uniref:Uncharacterized protein n=1 Tax=Aspergillus sclerotialis TaxID=2070753 RepID=A0A3A2ZSQ2_9EURO|nr:hypothetical protein PHISCL_01528 [Aspergillus sclerotialis]
MSLVLAAAAFLTAAAQICNPPYGKFGHYYWVDRQSALDGIAEHCITVNGSIIITHNYTGSFYLPNIRNITGVLRWDIYSFDTAPTLPSVELPDLEHMGDDLMLSGIPTLRNVSMPKLKTVRSDISIDYIHGADFRSLEKAKSIELKGNMSSLRLDSLRTVSRFLRICNIDECDPDVSPDSPLDISLPSLQSVGSLKIKGRISSLEVPSLMTVAGYELFMSDPDSLEFSTGGGPTVNLTFPRLSFIRESENAS